MKASSVARAVGSSGARRLDLRDVSGCADRYQDIVVADRV